jgi:MoxR-like ATPase
MPTNDSRIFEFSQRLIRNLEKVIIGKHNTLELVTLGLLAQGHLLIDDVPGVGKTMMARTLAKSLGASFARIQFTPDMLPSDVTGISIFNQGSRQFEYRPGPVMTQILLADEINRATPKTQSALLEAMEERQVTVDGITHKLPDPFLVLATQNPIEYEGTFPLPEAQLDRFFMKIHMGYPAASDEVKILEAQQLQHPILQVTPVAETEELQDMQRAVKHIFVADEVKRYIVDIIRTTRDNQDVYLGSSPRGSLYLFKASQIFAAMNQRNYVIPDDVKYLAEPVLSHRIILNPAARLKHITPGTLLHDLMRQIPVPGGKLKPED